MSPELASRQHLELLTRINLDDLAASFGWEHSRFGRTAASGLFRGPARRFARQVIAFDDLVSRRGFQEGARCILPAFLNHLHIEGQAHIPVSGPLLILSNHPGMADTLALFSALPRTDLYILASDRPFLKALPAVSKQLIFVTPQERLQALHSMIHHLRCGDAVVTFPAGQIEPDPAVLPGAVESLETWSESIAIPIRLVPELTIVIAVVSGVLSPQATFHPLTRLRRQQKDRERLGAALQLLVKTLRPSAWPVNADLVISPPLTAAALAPMHDPRAIKQAIIDYIRPYIARVACKESENLASSRSKVMD